MPVPKDESPTGPMSNTQGFWPKTMKDNNDRQAVYEVSYLIGDSVAEENVPAEADKIKKIIADAGASVIAEELPRKEDLAYTIRKKTVSGSYHKFDSAYFGWVKFEIGTDKIETIKKSVELVPSVIRSLVITTVRENTYLGKRASAIAKTAQVVVDEKVADEKTVSAGPAATVEDMDKSIDDMVKEV